LRALEEHEDWNAYISPQPLGQNQAGKLTYHDFEYDAERDTYRCPGGAECGAPQTVDSDGTRISGRDMPPVLRTSSDVRIS
jgi:hypothetical protein